MIRPLGTGQLNLRFARAGAGAVLDDTISASTSVSGSIQINPSGSLSVRGAFIGAGSSLEINGTAGNEVLNLTSPGVGLAAGSKFALNGFVAVAANAAISGAGELVLGDGVTLSGNQNLSPDVLST